MPPDADVQGTIHNLIRRLRFDHGEMTQQELAVRVGVTRQTIIALEAGKYVPSLLLAFRLARAFGVSVEGGFQYNDGEHNSSAVSDPIAKARGLSLADVDGGLRQLVAAGPRLTRLSPKLAGLRAG